MDNRAKVELLSRRITRLIGELEDIKDELESLTLESASPDSSYALSQEKHTAEPEVPYFDSFKSMPQDLFVAKGEPIVAQAVVEPVHSSVPALMDYISVIDLFRFRRELFGDDMEEMKRVLSEMGRLGSQEEARRYAREVLRMDPKQETVADFLVAIASYFPV